MAALSWRALRLVFVCALTGLPWARATTLVLVPSGELPPALESIVAGVRDAADDIDIRAVDAAELRIVLDGAGSAHEAVIVLGRELIEENDIVVDEVPVLLGGFTGAIANVSDLPYVSLNVDPNFALEQIQKTGPPVNQLRSVLPPDAITEPEVTALLALDEIEVKNLAFANGERATARAWFETLGSADGPDEMLWVINDRHLDGSGTYRYLMENAWRQDLLVVSTIPSYARRGVAVGFIPDLRAYGELLIQTVELLVDDPGHTPSPLLGAEVVQRVFNRRALEHVGRRLPTDLDRTGRIDIIIE